MNNFDELKEMCEKSLKNVIVAMVTPNVTVWIVLKAEKLFFAHKV